MEGRFAAVSSQASGTQQLVYGHNAFAGAFGDDWDHQGWPESAPPRMSAVLTNLRASPRFLPGLRPHVQVPLPL